jgi:hypothetical protein
MTADLPGRPVIDVDNPPPERAPSLVTPAVIYMSSEDAPTGKTFQASSGNFSMATMYSNDGASLGVNANFESFLECKDEIQDMTKAEEGSAFRRRQAKKKG